MTTPIRAAIAALPDYSYAPREVPGVARVIQLGQNELGVPPSPLALAALGDPAHWVNRYADDGHDALRAAIGRVHGLDPERIMVAPWVPTGSTTACASRSARPRRWPCCARH